jgi:hypothetical protein
MKTKSGEYEESSHLGNGIIHHSYFLVLWFVKFSAYNSLIGVKGDP